MIRRIEKSSLLSLLVLIIATASASAQQQTTAPPATPAAKQPTGIQPVSDQDAAKTPPQLSSPQIIQSVAGQDDQSYRIGPGDLLDIRVFGRAELTREQACALQATSMRSFRCAILESRNTSLLSALAAFLLLRHPRCIPALYRSHRH